MRGSNASARLRATLASCLDDPGITRVLNMKQTTTPRGLPWTQERVHQFRKHHHHIRLTPPSNDPNILNSTQAAEHLGISRRALLSLVSREIVDSGQVTDFAPWAVSKAQLDSEAVQNAVLTIKNPQANLNQGDGANNQGLLFSTISEKE